MGLSVALKFCFLEEIIFYKVYYLPEALLELREEMMLAKFLLYQ